MDEERRFDNNNMQDLPYIIGAIHSYNLMSLPETKQTKKLERKRFENPARFGILIDLYKNTCF